MIHSVRTGALLLLAIASLLMGCGSGGASAPGGENTATLEWDAVTDSSLSGYRIYYGTAPGTYSQPVGEGVDVGNVTSYMVTGLSSGTQYYYAVTAYDVSGRESTYSNEVF